ncbi:GSCOCG00013261001-RA-CDS [Cotesia congregata]|uniref:Similar to Lcp1: Plastin-2 (Mus musculus) n=1 Tax=Cotesia congregata TaxID=51543 RepID=A0A8J2MNQ8_COTCN|nr:GSCOCG00013261001-RA-CDS [Cotesia congregata]CAG5094050.1 Similar to Lcp1: Plastin-2 (Mus musculus) [Cotesia congregata]
MEMLKMKKWNVIDEYLKDFPSFFKLIDENGDGFIDVKELRSALDICGFKMPGYKVRQMIEEYDDKQQFQHKGRLSFDEFEKLCKELKANELGSTFKQVVSKKENLETLGGISEASSEGTTHSVRLEEQLAFSDWINTNLGSDPDLKHLLPIDPEGRLLYDKVKDGILLCKIINHSCPDTIDERTINKEKLTLYKKHENLTLALSSAQSIGCNIVNIDAHDLTAGRNHLVLGLLWQIIRIGLFNQITLENCPGLATLLQHGEKIEDLLKLSPEAILLRWVNHHLENAGVARRCNNFQSDITDSEVYTYLIKQIAPSGTGVTLEALMEPNHVTRAEIMLQQAAKLGCRSFVTPNDVVNGIYKLNLAFVANMFNNYPGLDKPAENIEDLGSLEETREEKTYRNWMNSMGVSPHVNWLYSDLADGLVIFQLYDIIKPGTVNWPKVHTKFSKLRKFMEKLENCNYAVDLGKKMNFSLVGIAGQDINDGNATLTLALIWQLMRSYTLSVLSGLVGNSGKTVEKEIVQWVNSKLQAAGKTSSIKSFQDDVISTGRPVLDLIDAIKPGIVNYDLVKTSETEEDNLDNAKYAISLARKCGARVYALPEDITEVKQKMVMTVFVCLMATDYVPNMDSKQNNVTQNNVNNVNNVNNTNNVNNVNGQS